MHRLIADPIFITMMLLLVGVCLRFYRRRVGFGFIGAAAFFLYLLATPWVSARLLLLAEPSSTAARPAQDSQPEAIVVLSAGLRHAPEYGGMTVDALTLERLRYAAKLQRETGLPVLVSGGRIRGYATSVAEAMRTTLAKDFQVPVRWLEPDSHNTEENARLSAAILKSAGITTVYVVTHAVHMARAAEAFERSGLTVAPAPTVFTSVEPTFELRVFLPHTSALADSHYALHEHIGRLWYRLTYG